MRRINLLLFLLLLVLASSIPIYAQSDFLVLDPPALTVAGTLDGGTFAASLQLLSMSDIDDVRIVASDLTDATGDGFLRDPLPASVVTLLPDSKFVTLAADSLTQVLVQVTPPPVAGTYTGTLRIHWMKPTPGSLTVPLTVVARTRPVLTFQGANQIAISGTRGASVTRQVTLRETTPRGSASTGIHAVSQDLLTANGKILEAERISIDLPSNEVIGGNLLTATVLIKLHGLAPGIYTGEVLFESNVGTPLSLPLTVNVRYRALGPIIVLILGVAAGLYLSWYQAKGKTRDELTLRVVAVRKEMSQENGPQAGFHIRIEMWLNKAEAAIRIKEWDVGTPAVEEAEALLRKWHAGDWQGQIAYLQELGAKRIKVAQDKEDTVALQNLQHQVQTALETVDGLETPADLREKTLAIEKTLARFEHVRQQYEAMNQIRTEAPASLDDRKEAWRRKLNVLNNQISQCIPESPAWEQLEKDLQALGEQIQQDIDAAPPEPSSVTLEGTTKRCAAEESTVGIHIIALFATPFRLAQQPPDAGPFTLRHAQKAKSGLIWFALLTNALGGLVLAAMGFSAFYLSNPAFGAQPVTDYLALLAWGLGAETTFSSVVGLLNGWNVPFGKKAS